MKKNFIALSTLPFLALGAIVPTVAAANVSKKTSSAKISSAVTKVYPEDITQLKPGDGITAVNMGAFYKNVDPKHTWTGYDDFDLFVWFNDSNNAQWVLEFSHANYDSSHTSATDMITFIAPNGSASSQVLYYNGMWLNPSFSVEQITNGCSTEWFLQKVHYTDGIQKFVFLTPGICEVDFAGNFSFDGK